MKKPSPPPYPSIPPPAAILAIVATSCFLFYSFFSEWQVDALPMLKRDGSLEPILQSQQISGVFFTYSYSMRALNNRWNGILGQNCFLPANPLCFYFKEYPKISDYFYQVKKCLFLHLKINLLVRLVDTFCLSIEPQMNIKKWCLHKYHWYFSFD